MSKNITVTMTLEQYEHLKAQTTNLEQVLQDNWEAQAQRVDALFASVALPATVTDSGGVEWSLSRYGNGSVHLCKMPPETPGPAS